MIYIQRCAHPNPPMRRYADLTDLDIPFKSPDSTLFPGVDPSVKVHSGFADEHAKTALIILNEVERLMTLHNTKTVTAVGNPWTSRMACP